MSEIYNGSFVLGNTSATTLSAGPGIKIDDSTPGVIKVSNDETVLWSGTAAKSGTLSEYVSAFDYVKFYCTDDAKNSFVITMDGTCSAAGNTLILTPNSGGATYRTLNAEVTGKDFAIWGSQFGFNGTTTAIGWVNGRTSNNTWTLATKVIGINRISGGN